MSANGFDPAHPTNVASGAIIVNFTIVIKVAF